MEEGPPGGGGMRDDPRRLLLGPCAGREETGKSSNAQQPTSLGFVFF